MRFGVRVVLCLLALALVAGSGCRKPLTPNIDRNEPPETWITAAPMDTLTVKNAGGQVGNPPSITTIPVRFHLYWAGSDPDGAVAGYYFAVVETTATVVEGVTATLPGPKPQDYHFTTKTDTTFIFNVTENAPDRQHAFFLYAVDNQGKPDPTPARFIFNAIDKFPPQPVIVLAQATGDIVVPTPGGGVQVEDHTYAVTDTFNRNTFTRDTVPMGAQLDFAWRGQITLAGTYVTGYRYKLDEPQFVSVDSSVHSVSYGTGLPGSSPVTPGTKVFYLLALDQAGGAGQTSRRFVVNFSPDTWWAGPDPAQFPPSTDGEANSRAVDVLSWPTENASVALVTNPPLPPSTFGPDSLKYRPLDRKPPGNDYDHSRTFYEFYRDRIYARSEGDTVHMNSWVILWNGGYDKDSWYTVRVDSTDPVISRGGSMSTDSVVTRAQRVGSPIGFRSLIATKLTPFGTKSVPAQTTMYPIWEPASVFRAPRIGGYWRMFQTGAAYAIARAEDADGGIDQAIADPVRLVDNVDGGHYTQDEYNLRRKVIKFYVNKAPALTRKTVSDGVHQDTLRSWMWTVTMNGMDLDPYDPNHTGWGAGGPTPEIVLRYKITVWGKNFAGRDTGWVYLDARRLPYIETAGQTSKDIYPGFIPGVTNPSDPPSAYNYFATGPIRISLQICDCRDCETTAGQGRCVDGIVTLGGVPVVSNPDNIINTYFIRPSTGPESVPTADRPGSAPSGRRE